MANCKTNWICSPILLIYALNVFTAAQRPEQIHLSYGDDDSSMRVTWSTLNKTDRCFCVSGISSVKYITFEGYSTLFDVGHTQYIHRVTFNRLKYGQQYWYQCGDGKWMSDVYTFKAKRTDRSYQPRIAFYGDLGVIHEQIMGKLTTEINKGDFDVILHVGDFAYNMESYDSRLGDQFMNMIQPLTTQIPYMTCPGNHEVYGNFTNYKHRFTMPNDVNSSKMFYSFNLGPAHIISFSTEYYFDLQYGVKQIWEQWKWLREDLKKANKNRNIHPWIITMGHKPMYCSNNTTADCTNNESVIRTGLPFFKAFGLEKLFYENGVDLTLWAHQHSYERLWPLYDRRVMNSSTNKPYTNPQAPVHIITGSAGCCGLDPFKNNTRVAPWSAFRALHYGYSSMQIFNRSHLYMEQVSTDDNEKDPVVIDQMWLIKNTHGPYG